MNGQFRLALIVAGAAMAAACTSEQFYRGIYEGSRVRQDALGPTGSVVGRQTSPDFDQYEAERRRLHSAPADATPETPASTPR